jgi:beta-catenin-like protein 1
MDGIPFIPSQTFNGERIGYYFGRGKQGVGYYIDANGPHAIAPGNHHHHPSLPYSTKQPSASLDPQELLRQAEKAAAFKQEAAPSTSAPPPADGKAVKKLAAALEKRYRTNMESRLKHADDPTKFLESELDLDEAVKSLLSVASTPQLYPDLVEAGAIPTLLTLLTHDNADIAADALELLSELTDTDAVEDNRQESRILVDAMLENDALKMLAERIKTLNMNEDEDEEEATAVYRALSIVENMVELRPTIADAVVKETRLLQWLVGQLNPKTEVDSNKQYVCEIVSILAAASDEARTALIERNSSKSSAATLLDKILQAIAPYRTKDAQGVDEEEYVENLFNIVCSCLMKPQGQAAFLDIEGIELMLIVLKNKTSGRGGALKVLDYATTRYGPACCRIVTANGLKTVFAVFMGKLKSKMAKKDAAVAREDDERIMSIISNMCINLVEEKEGTAGGIMNGDKPPHSSTSSSFSSSSPLPLFQRLAAKFVENSFEKCDRLMELFFNYNDRVAAAAQDLFQAMEENEMDEDELLLTRMDAGLYTLQQAATIIATLWSLNNPVLQKRVLQSLHQKGRTLGSVRQVLVEQRLQIGGDGDEGDEESGDGRKKKERQVARLTKFLTAMGMVEKREGSEDEDGDEEGRDTKRVKI